MMTLLVVARREFTEYTSRAVGKLTRTIAETSASLESNKWLAGAKVGSFVKEKYKTIGTEMPKLKIKSICRKSLSILL